MRVADLSAPVTAAKADWLPARTWLGFTPQGVGPDAKAKCEATILRQFGNGYVLERVTSAFGKPNAGYENDPRVVRERDLHGGLSDGLVAIHRLRHSSLPLEKIVGAEEFDFLQNTWATSDRNRWSVAFAIVESYEIVGTPKAKGVFGAELHKRLFQSQSAVLRPLGDDARRAIADLEIREVSAPNLEIEIEQEIEFAAQSQLDAELETSFDDDLAGCWEGETEERRVKLKKRAVWLARNFAKDRERQSRLRCDHCSFDAAGVDGIPGARRRSAFDVHHLTPISGGRRYSSISDFALLCPTCHRIEHMRMKARIA